MRPWKSNKLDYRTQNCIFLGYSSSHHNYLSFNPLNNKKVISCHVVFSEESIKDTPIRIHHHPQVRPPLLPIPKLPSLIPLLFPYPLHLHLHTYLHQILHLPHLLLIHSHQQPLHLFSLQHLLTPLHGLQAYTNIVIKNLLNPFHTTLNHMPPISLKTVLILHLGLLSPINIAPPNSPTPSLSSLNPLPHILSLFLILLPLLLLCHKPPNLLPLLLARYLSCLLPLPPMSTPSPSPPCSRLPLLPQPPSPSPLPYSQLNSQLLPSPVPPSYQSSPPSSPPPSLSPLSSALISSTPPSLEEPIAYLQASMLHHWRQALDAELACPPTSTHFSYASLNIICCKWVFKVKTKADGSVERCKARLVAKGFNQ